MSLSASTCTNSNPCLSAYFFIVIVSIIEEEELIKEEALEAERQLESEFNNLEEHESKNYNDEVV